MTDFEFLMLSHSVIFAAGLIAGLAMKVLGSK